MYSLGRMALETIGLRYFNVFGPRQDPNGAYAAVIPRWVSAMSRGEPVFINGDGETSRDFCYVANAVQANLLAATVDHADAINQVFNVAVGARTNLNRLFELIRDNLLQACTVGVRNASDLSGLQAGRRAPFPGRHLQGSPIARL